MNQFLLERFQANLYFSMEAKRPSHKWRVESYLQGKGKYDSQSSTCNGASSRKWICRSSIPSVHDGTVNVCPDICFACDTLRSESTEVLGSVFYGDSHDVTEFGLADADTDLWCSLAFFYRGQYREVSAWRISKTRDRRRTIPRAGARIGHVWFVGGWIRALYWSPCGVCRVRLLDHILGENF